MRFKFEGEWKVKKLGEVMEFIKDKLPSASLSTKNYVSTENLLQDFQGITLASSIPSNVNVTAYKTNDILFSNIRPYLKKIWKANLSGGCSADVFVFRNNESCLSGFLYYSIANEDFINYVMIGAKGVKMPRGDKEQIQQYPISLPSLTEQAKIVSFLSLIDERILTQSKIIEGLKELKASLSNQIFSRKLRFKDENGDDFPEWKEKMLGEIGEIIGGGTPDTNTPEYWDGDINWFVPSEIGKQKYISSSVRTISHIGLKNSSAKLLRDGTILLSTRATIGEKSILNGVGCTNQGFQSISVNNENINIFIYYLLDKYKVDMIKNASGSTFLEISSSNLKKIKVFVPSFLEQQKIASILSAIDKKIEIEKEILEEYTAQKKHLLKQMFI